MPLKMGGGGGRPLGMMVFGSLVAVPFGLGTWQMQRREWKKNLMDSRLEALRSEPVSLMDAITMGKTPGGDESRKVLISGTFDHKRELLVGPRSPPTGIVQPLQSASMSSNGTEASNPMGYHLLTPFRSDGDCVDVIVNRGWVPYNAGKTKEWERPLDHMKTVGVLTEGEETLSFMPDTSTSGPLLRANLPDVLERMGLNTHQNQQHNNVCRTLMIEAIGPDGPPPESFPLAKQEASLLDFHVSPETHLMYAITWYTLGAAVAMITRFRFRPR